VRHAYAPGAFDPPDARLEDCSTQRNLDESGRAQARRLGEAFRAHNVAVGRVLSSPRCRCLETARLAFKEPEAWNVLQGGRPNTEALRSSVAAIKQRIAEHRDGPPLVLVTHGFVITGLTGLDIRMGGFVVLQRGADGAPTVAGQLYVE
jgi:broad specificity phosphatase PhoE